MKTYLKWSISLVWLINGIVCKILNLVPRHQEIVSKILQLDNARPLTVLIGFGEVLIAIIILSEKKVSEVVYFQIAIVLFMNLLESIIAPELLLWGKLNIVFATIFCFILLYYMKLYKESMSQ